MMQNTLEEARRIINEVDAQMAELFVRRMRAAEMVAEYKKVHGMPVLDAAREAEVIRKSNLLNTPGPMADYYREHYLESWAIVEREQENAHE